MKLFFASDVLLLSSSVSIVFAVEERNLGGGLFGGPDKNTNIGIGKPKRDVSLTISSSKSVFAADEPVLIDITLKSNEVKKQARILDWVVPCEPKNEILTMPTEMSFFNIKTAVSSVAAKYMGALFKRPSPTNKDYKTLKPGEEISCTIDMSKYYEFTAGSDDDSYEIMYSVASMQLSNPYNNRNSIESLDSNSITVNIKARDPPLPPDDYDHNLRGLQTGGTSFNGCSTSRQNDLRQARSYALTAVRNLDAPLAKVGQEGSSSVCQWYDEWFGTFSSTRHNELNVGFKEIRNQLNDASIRFECTCTRDVYAYVYTNRPYTIFLCNLFWSAPMTGTDSKMGTIIHEMSHFTITAGTNDYTYGQANCRMLADNNPSQAINNADNHEYMAENSPALSCNPAPTPSPSCMSGQTRVEIESGTGQANGDAQFKYVQDLNVGDTIQGLDVNMMPTTCSIEAVGHFGTGPVFGNYTEDHFILDPSGNVVLTNGNTGMMEEVDKYTVLTSCPVGLDESGIGFTAFDSDFLGDNALAWSDYVVIHQSIYNIVKEVGSFVFSPETYTSMTKVKQYTSKFQKTMLNCAKNPKQCNAFEKAAVDLLDNALTKDAKEKVKSSFGNLGKSNMPGSVSAAVTKGKSVRV